MKLNWLNLAGDFVNDIVDWADSRGYFTRGWRASVREIMPDGKVKIYRHRKREEFIVNPDELKIVYKNVPEESEWFMSYEKKDEDI